MPHPLLAIEQTVEACRQRWAQPGGGLDRVGELGRVGGGQADHRRIGEVDDPVDGTDADGGVRVEEHAGVAVDVSDHGASVVVVEARTPPSLGARGADSTGGPEVAHQLRRGLARAVEQFEEAILLHSDLRRDDRIIPLHEIEIFDGLSTDDLRRLSAEVTTFQFNAGDKIISEGDDARIFFVVGRGSVSVSVNVDGRRPRRIGSVGQGGPFGEMALLDGGKRSADVIADVPVICYGFSVDRIREMSVESPMIMTTILGNLVRIMSDRLRLANDEIRALQ